MSLRILLRKLKLRRILSDGGYHTKTIEAARELAHIGDSTGVRFFTSRLLSSDHDVSESAAKELSAIGWQPSSEQERIDLIIAGRDWSALLSFGDRALDILLEAVTTKRYPAVNILLALEQIETPAAQEKLVEFMKDGTLDWATEQGRTNYSKSEWIAESLNNSRSQADAHIVCSNCHKYLWIRKELPSRRISETEKRAAAQQRVDILADYVHACRHCGSRMFL